MNRRRFLMFLASLPLIGMLPGLTLTPASANIRPRVRPPRPVNPDGTVSVPLNYWPGRPTVNGRVYDMGSVVDQFSRALLPHRYPPDPPRTGFGWPDLLVMDGPPPGTRFSTPGGYGVGRITTVATSPIVVGEVVGMNVDFEGENIGVDGRSRYAKIILHIRDLREPGTQGAMALTDPLVFVTTTGVVDMGPDGKTIDWTTFHLQGLFLVRGNDNLPGYMR